MRRIHLAVGILTVLVFLATGQLIRHHTPRMAELGDAARLLYRSRHIYILAAGLVNLMLGLYIEQKPDGWRTAVQRVGSALLVLSSALLMTAFAAEPPRGFRPEMPWSSAGLYALFAGAMLHVVSDVGRTVARHVVTEPRP